MKFTLAEKSIFLFGVSLVLLILLTLFESSLTELSLGAERVITFLVLVVPAFVGAIYGGISLARKDGNKWLAVFGVLLNSLFGIFHLMIVLFAG